MINFMNGFVPGAVSWVDKRRPKMRQIVCAAALAVLASGCVSETRTASSMQQTKEQKIEAGVREMPGERLLSLYGRYAAGVDGSYDARYRYFAMMRVFEERKEQPRVLAAVEGYALSRGDATAVRDAVRFLQRACTPKGRAAMSDMMVRVYRQSRMPEAKSEALTVLEEENIKVPEIYYDLSGSDQGGILKETEERYRAFVNRS